MNLELSQINVGTRFRKDMGEIDELAKSITEIGLLQPVIVDINNKLIDGGRRIEAFKKLGRNEIPARQIDLDDLHFLQAEYDANECRKAFTPSEKYAIAQARAEQLKGRWGGDRKSDQDARSRTLNDAGPTRNLIAAEVGLGSGRTLERVGTILSRGTPELIQAMDAGDISINKAEELANLPKEDQAKIKFDDSKELRRMRVQERKDQEMEKAEARQIKTEPNPMRHFEEGMPYAAATFAYRAITAIGQIAAKDPNALKELQKIEVALNKHINLIKGELQ